MIILGLRRSPQQEKLIQEKILIARPKYVSESILTSMCDQNGSKNNCNSGGQILKSKERSKYLTLWRIKLLKIWDVTY